MQMQVMIPVQEFVMVVVTYVDNAKYIYCADCISYTEKLRMFIVLCR